MLLRGDLGVFDSEWSGWIVRRGKLYSPEGWEVSMSNVLASRLHEIQLAAWRTEVQRMKARIAELEAGGILDEQPTPDQWDVQILAG